MAFTSLSVSNHTVTLDQSVDQRRISPGCGDLLNVCRGAPCGAHGQCFQSAESPSRFVCKCEEHWSGERCDHREPHCIKRKYTDYHVTEAGCRTVKKLKNAVCKGECGADGCCRPVTVKKRTKSVLCPNGQRTTAAIEIVRKCACASPSCGQSQRWRRFW